MASGTGPSPNGTASVEVSDLVVRYSDVTAVDGISFSLDAGTVLALLGPNGAGKTTTVETIEGFRRPTSGSVRVLGLDPIRNQREVAPRIGVMLQSGGVYPGMTAREIVGLFASYFGSRSRHPAELIEEVGLSGVANTPWRRLSGGEQQRVSLALALVGSPEVLFLDEPSAGMDPVGRQTLWELVRGLRDDGVAVLLTTHYLEEASHLADDVVIVDHGRVVAMGSPAELMAAGAGEDIRFAAPPGLDTGALGTRLGAVAQEIGAGEYVVHLAPTPANVAALTAWLAERDLPLGDLRASRQSLQDVFLRLTGKGDA